MWKFLKNIIRNDEIKAMNNVLVKVNKEWCVIDK